MRCKYCNKIIRARAYKPIYYASIGVEFVGAQNILYGGFNRLFYR